jgi:DNA-binding response OmpR family regulator
LKTYTEFLLPGRGSPIATDTEHMTTLTPAQTDRALKVLVVDDDPGVRGFISGILGRTGFEVIEAPDAEQALIAFEAGGSAVDLVVTDVKMPGMSGCDLARMLLAAHPTLPILLVSGSHSESPTSLPLLQKPFTPSRLLAALWWTLAERRHSSNDQRQ